MPNPARPALLPSTAWVRWALLALCLFGLVRGGIFAATTPSFWGPDEDYHMMYVDHVAAHGTIIDPDRPLYSDEYIQTTRRTFYTAYGSGPRLDKNGQPNFRGDPKRVIAELANLPSSSREQRHTGRDPGVVHAPLYYYPAAVPDWLAYHLNGKAMPTRMLWVRMWSALLGVLAVYGAWLFATQVFGYGRRAILVGLLVATQPMVSYWSGLVSNDIGAIALFALVLAQLAFMMRYPPSGRQGVWLGALLAVALLIKSTALVLLPLSAVALVAQAVVFREATAELTRSVRNVLLVAAGPLLTWYIWSRLSYGTFTGEVLVEGVASSGGGETKDSGFAVSDYVVQARAWFADVYRTSWFHFAAIDAPRGRWVYFAPASIIALCWLGAASFAWSMRTSLGSRSDARLRQLVLCVLVLVFLTVPLLRLDLARQASGAGFLVNAGRLMLPAYPAFAVIAVLAIDWLVSPVSRRFVLSALGFGSAALLCHVWAHHFVARYYGDGSWGEKFYRMSFDRPWFVAPATYWIAVAVSLALLVALAVLVARRPTIQRAA